jgi:hypothetical protein
MNSIGNRRLLLADIIPYYWTPRFWLRWKKYWNHDHWRIYGIDGRLWFVGFAIKWDRAGVFHNGSKLGIVFLYRPWIEEMLM